MYPWLISCRADTSEEFSRLFRAEREHDWRVIVLSGIMVRKNNIDSSPTKKRPKLQQNSDNASPGSRQRPLSRGTVVDGAQTTDGEPGSNMRSIADLIGGGRSRAEAALGDDAPDDAWAVITNTLDNLGSASAFPSEPNDESKSRVVYEPDVVASGETMNATGKAREVAVDRLVRDLSLKTKIHVSSPNPLFWALCRSQVDEDEALSRLLAGESAHANRHPAKRRQRSQGRSSSALQEAPSAEQVIEAKRHFYEGLLHFRCPSGPLPAKISADWQALTAGYAKVSRQVTPSTDSQTVAVERLLLWQSALQSVFYAYRRKRLDNFYVVLPSTALIFTRERKSSDLRAALAKASPGLRALMKDYAVPFSVVDGTDGFEEPCVVVQGAVAVHALYNCLSAIGHRISNARDVPTLLADKPFRGSTIVPANVFNARKVYTTDMSYGGSGKVRQHLLQMRGLFTPRQIETICSAFATTQNSGFEAKFEAEPMSTMLNTCGHGHANEDDDHELRGPLVLSKVRVTAEVEGIMFSTKDA